MFIAADLVSLIGSYDIHVLLSSYVRVYVRSPVFLFFLSKNRVNFRICNPLGIFRRNFIHNGICMFASHVRPCKCPFICLHSVLSKTMRVHFLYFRICYSCILCNYEHFSKKKYFISKPFVKVELSYVFTIKCSKQLKTAWKSEFSYQIGVFFSCW